MAKYAVKIISLIGLILLVFSVCGRAGSISEMRGINVEKVSEAKSVVSVRTTDLVKYHCFRVTNPPRLVIEITNAVHNAEQKVLEVNNSLIKRIRSSQYEEEPIKIVRIVLDLQKTVEYEATAAKDGITLSIFSQEEKTAGKTEQKTVSPPPPAEKTAPAPVAVTAEEKKAEVKKEPAAARKEAPAPARPVEARNVEDTEHRRLVEKVRAEEKKKAAQEKREKEEVISALEGVTPPVSSEPVTLNFYEADVLDVFRILSVQTGMNFIYGADVKGLVTIQLKNVPFDDAFRSILKLTGLVAQKEAETIIRIVTPEQLKAERSKAVKITRRFLLRYTRAEDLQAQLKEMEFGGTKAVMSTDKTTNSLIITTTPEGLEDYEKIIKELDVMPKQVMIEAKIVEIETGGKDMQTYDMGVKWSVARDLTNRAGMTSTTDDLLTIGGTKDENDISNTEGFDGTKSQVVDMSGGGTGIDLGKLSTSGMQLVLGSILNKTRFNLAIAALAQTGKLKMLSHPRIATLNNEKAEVLIGDRIPVKEVTLQQGTAVEAVRYIDVGIRLVVTPTINADNYVTLQVHPEISTYFKEDFGTGISTRETTTKVLVKNGDTLVIGGLIKDKDQTTITKVPVLGDIPVLNVLFKRKRIFQNRVELMVFITPTIIEQE